MELTLLFMPIYLATVYRLPPLTPQIADWQALLLIILTVALALVALAVLVGWRGVRLAAFADRVVVYGLLAALLLCFYVAGSLILTSYLPDNSSYLHEVAAALMALFVAVTYAPISRLVQRLVDRAVYRDFSDYEGTLQRFSEKLAASYDQETLAQVLLDGLVEALNLSAIAFVPLPEGLDQQVLAMIGPGDVRARGSYATPKGQAEMLRRLAQLKVGAAHMPPAMQMTLSPWKGCSALAYIGAASQTGVSALLALGPKATGSQLRREDIALVQTIAHQAATALANAQLVSGLRISLQQVQISTQQLMDARTEQELLLHELVNAEERQRASLARELHDDALQEVLYVIRHSRHALRLADAWERGAGAMAGEQEKGDALAEARSLPAQPSDRMRQELRELAERSIIAEKKLRALCFGLYPEMLNSLGLTPSLEDLAAQMATVAQMTVRVECDEVVKQITERLDPQVSLHLYRIAQECLSNAHKHGQASAATVSLAALEAPTDKARWLNRWSWIRLQVRDNGSGIALPVDIGASLREGHLGLASMRERAQLIGGRLYFEQAPEGGAQVTVIAPVARILRTVPLEQTLA
ncbi:MAG TPA: ATP-binding protein [Ktedonobacterales bacterium]